MQIDVVENATQTGTPTATSSRTTGVAPDEPSSNDANEGHGEAVQNESGQMNNSTGGTSTDQFSTPVDNQAIYIETASVESTRTTKPDPLASLADNFEKTVGSVSGPVPSSSVDDSAELDAKMRHLERIINAVQRMIDPGSYAAAGILSMVSGRRNLFCEI